jgi:hypothetical protein
MSSSVGSVATMVALVWTAAVGAAVRPPSVSALAGHGAASGDQAPTGRSSGAPAPDGRGQGRRGGGVAGGGPIPFTDRTGFRDIFDGKTLAGWDGDPALWRAEGGAIVGETTAAAPVKQNSFVIWRGGEPADFELKLEFRINSTNSGVQYRSVQVPPGGDIGRWVLKGYQADIDYNNQYTGMLYEERGRAFLAPRGTFGYVGTNQPAPGQRGQPAAPGTTPAGPRGQLGLLENGDALKAFIKQDDWNQFHVIARGHMLVHVLNGHVMALFLDDDPVGRSAKGLIGLQIHEGPPMKVEFRNIWLKTL